MGRLIFVDKAGKDINGNNIFEFYFSDNADNLDIDGWDEGMAGLCDGLAPEKSQCGIVTASTGVPFDLVQDQTCFGMVDAVNGIIALAWENIDYYEEYPEEGRLIFKFGESEAMVRKKLSIRGIETD